MKKSKDSKAGHKQCINVTSDIYLCQSWPGILSMVTQSFDEYLLIWSLSLVCSSHTPHNNPEQEVVVVLMEIGADCPKPCFSTITVLYMSLLFVDCIYLTAMIYS
jgi:hypothetical protein